MNDPLPELSLTGANYTVDHWLPRAEYDHIDLDAPYQRDSVWDIERRRNLIKSLIMGLPTGVVIVAKLPYDKKTTKSFRVVDGKQRIETVRMFFNDDFDVPGWWFQERDVEPMRRHTNVFFSELTQRGQRSLGNKPFGSLEFESGHFWVENPDYDPTLDPYHKNSSDPRTRQFLWENRTPEEMLVAEAELYLLVNFGGVEHTDEDRDRAEGFG